MENKKELLLSYVKTNVAPILVDFIFGEDLEDAVVLDSKIDVKELNGHYEGINFVAPKWLSDLMNTSTGKMLVIDNLDSISKEEQIKFVEILKYRKVSTFELPKNLVIIVTAKNINSDTINREIYSLVAHIGG